MVTIASMALAACTPVGGGQTTASPAGGADGPPPVYGAIQTRLLEGDLVAIDVSMHNAADPDHVIAFNDCAAAQYALIRGAPFVRRVTNDVRRRGRAWTGAGVYTLSDAFPGGTFTIDASVTAQACQADNIPMV